MIVLNGKNEEKFKKWGKSRESFFRSISLRNKMVVMCSGDFTKNNSKWRENKIEYFFIVFLLKIQKNLKEVGEKNSEEQKLNFF